MCDCLHQLRGRDRETERGGGRREGDGMISLATFVCETDPDSPQWIRHTQDSHKQRQSQVNSPLPQACHLTLEPSCLAAAVSMYLTLRRWWWCALLYRQEHPLTSVLSGLTQVRPRNEDAVNHYEMYLQVAHTWTQARMGHFCDACMRTCARPRMYMRARKHMHASTHARKNTHA